MWDRRGRVFFQGTVHIQWMYDEDASCTNYEDIMKLDNIQFIPLADHYPVVDDFENVN